MNKISRVIDFLISRTVIFTLAFIWCRYYLNSLWLAVLSAAGITLLACLILFLISRAKNARKSATKAEQIHMQQVMTEFMYSTNKQNVEYFYKLIKNEYAATLLPDCVLCENNKIKTLLFTRFKYAALSPDDIREFYIECRRFNAQRAIVFASDVSDKARSAASGLTDAEIILMNAENTYKFLKEFNMYPVITVKTAPEKRRKIKTLLKFAFSRNKVKTYLWGAGIMLLCSFAVPYNLYYLISATVMMVCALISFINPAFVRDPEKSLL